jgi:hypothetical protein
MSFDTILVRSEKAELKKVLFYLKKGLELTLEVREYNRNTKKK